MRIVLGLLCGVLGAAAGGFGFGALFMALSGPDRNGDIAMAAVLVVAPIGGLAGFLAGVLLFWRLAPARRATRAAGVVLGAACAVAVLSCLAWLRLMGM